ncbi:MAG: glutaminyl-peptide cyclotransferase [Cyclobacteriaceae bacterium]|nr:glutaminyl-peptide cyclotransferase [Cyclobacteriaceae bacterium]
MRMVWLTLLAGVTLVACSTNEKQIRSSTEIPFTVQSTLPHDPKAFTQGLLIHRGELYESTGQDSSWIGIVDIGSGKATRKVVLDNKYFGEGIAVLNNKVYQLTWKNKNGFIYSMPDFKKIGEFSYKGEGWGLTTDGRHLIMSNGTEEITFLDSASLKPVRTLTVKHDGVAVSDLNELEYVDGSLYANIWQTNLVARIELETGEVTGFLDLTELSQQARRVNPNADVLNGIAWHPATKTMLVTGKFWPYLFVLKLK